MNFVVLLVAFAHLASSGNVAVRMPFINPAGVTYIDSTHHVGLAAGPVGYHAQPVLRTAYAAPSPLFAPGPIAAYPRFGHHVAYAAPAVKYASVPTVHHVQGVADVPVTRIEAQPAVIQKLVDVAKPAIKTRKFEIRRPAIQKQFYDIEERIVVRPAGSALVELEEPLSQNQKGAAFIQPAAVAVPVVPAVRAVAALPFARAHYAPAYGVQYHRAPLTPFTTVHYPQTFGIAPAQFQFPQIAQTSSTPEPPQQIPSHPESRPQPQPQPQPQFDDDSVSIENPEIGFRSAQPQPISPAPTQEPAVEGSEPQPSASPVPESESPQNFQGPQSRAGPSSLIVNYPNALDLVPRARIGSPVVPSLRNLAPEVSQANQQRLIQLLTARGSVTEVGFGRAGAAAGPVGDAGQVRARVLSATPAPAYGEPAGERVNTRRVVVSRPIETLQEVEVAEPVTKIERIQVDHPTLIKSARQDFVRVPTSVPIYGKTFAPLAHAAVPVAHAAVHHVPVAPAYASHLSYYG